MNWRIEIAADGKKIEYEVITAHIIAINGLYHTVYKFDGSIVTLKVIDMSTIGSGIGSLRREAFVDIPVDLFGLITANHALGKKTTI